ncbi:energy transducer TonB [Xenorhabdus sp. VLS]|uniref:Energy transducer TonB n=2 Tax=Xenorhabdus lircayensis TaxID=2763499 RepID=A0ABS0U595_9GAMM|nr:energy transducer TonB [Xenorhabdus lircayensis]
MTNSIFHPMIRPADSFSLGRGFSLGGIILSVLFHLALLLIGINWFVNQSRQSGALPPAMTLQLGMYQLEKQADPDRAEGPEQVMSAPEATQIESPVKQPEQAKFPVIDQGNLAYAPEKKAKKELRKKIPIDVMTPETGSVSDISSAPLSGSAVSSSANFSSAASHAISGREGWENLIHGHLAKYKRYPRDAMRFKSSGVSHVLVRINSKGEIVLANILTSSGTKILDKEALATVRRAAPFPVPPHELLNGGVVEMVTPIIFDIKIG